MAKKQMSWKTKGMNRDLSVSAFNPEFSFENMNLRLSTNEGNTMMSWVTEKGTKLVSLRDTSTSTFTDSLAGSPVGTAVVGDKLVLFTASVLSPYNRIYIIEYDNTLECYQYSLYFEGSLGIYPSIPIETLVSYESDKIQKVYWTDGWRQPRVMNICVPAKKDSNNNYIESQFDFLPALQLKEDVSVSKVIGGAGKFIAGVIQYVFTYYNENGQESNIFYTSPLRYISPKGRGGAPNETIDNAFSITIQNPDTNFDYLRIYSIHRTSLNSTPFCKRVVDIKISDYSGDITYLDTGTVGDSIEPIELLFKNRLAIKAGTLEQKDATLFLGNLSYTKSKSIYKTFGIGTQNSFYDTSKHGLKVTYISDDPDSTKQVKLETEYNDLISPDLNSGSTSEYIYDNQLSLTNDDGELGSVCAGFKSGNKYRLGLQFQDKNGAWTGAIFLDDYLIDSSYHCYIDVQSNKNYYHFPRIECVLKRDLTKDLIDDGYVNVRPLVVLPEIHDRGVVMQTAVCPTMCTEKDRITDKKLLGQSSWFWRAGAKQFVEPAEEDVWHFTPYMRQYKWWAQDVGHYRYDYSYSTLAAPFSYHGLNTGIQTAGNVYIPYIDNVYQDITQNPWEDQGPNADFEYLNNIRQTEIQGFFNTQNRFIVDWKLLSMHSPDVEFGDEFAIPVDYYNFDNHNYQYVGYAVFSRTFSDIDIQTETPTASGDASGFCHQTAYVNDGPFGFIAGLFYEDFAVDDDSATKVVLWSTEKSPYKWLIYPWQGEGSLNNDINRTSDNTTDTGVQSSILKKKIISNLRYANSTTWILNDNSQPSPTSFYSVPKIFRREDGKSIKIKENNSATNAAYDATLYFGDVDTILTPDKPGPILFGFGDNTYNHLNYADVTTGFGNRWWYRFAYRSGDSTIHGVEHWPGTLTIDDWDAPSSPFDAVGNYIPGVAQKKSSVRMKYKSTSHLVASVNEDLSTVYNTGDNVFCSPIVEIQQTLDPDIIFGGKSLDALKANTWIIAGKAKPLGNFPDSNPSKPKTKLNFNYGDTYYQRYDCLKTYPYSSDDKNQIVEIASFMIETYLNIDGRYDKNRGEHSNLYMTPENFNLINPIYNQKDNFFSWKLEEEPTGDGMSVNRKFPNQITWSLPKTNGEEIDKWSYITLSSILELDGDKGAITSIQRYNNQLIAFQEKAVSQILYNEQAQIATTEGVPIEVANSGKVDGFRYLNNHIGCYNKWSICNSPLGIYFMDNFTKSIYLFNGEFKDLSLERGVDSWCKQNMLDISNPCAIWDSNFNTDSSHQAGSDLSGFVSYYDKINKEVLFINNKTCLAYNEKIDTFTSFYNYEETPYFLNFQGVNIWFSNDNTNTRMWLHQAGGYCNFFGIFKPYWATVISNPEPQTDKIFTNIEFRAGVDGDGDNNTITEEFTPILPFDSLETWNEYQHGILTLQNRDGRNISLHGGSTGVLARKYRIWRCDIPRDNAPLEDDADLNISRCTTHPIDRMRNPWLYLKLKKEPTINRQSFTTLSPTKRWINDAWYTYDMYVIPLSVFEDLFAIGASEIILNATYASENHLSWTGLNLETTEWIHIPSSSYYLTVPLSITPTLVNSWKAEAAQMMQTMDGIAIMQHFSPSESDYIYVEAKYVNKTEIHDLSLTYYN